MMTIKQSRVTHHKSADEDNINSEEHECCRSTATENPAVYRLEDSSPLIHIVLAVWFPFLLILQHTTLLALRGRLCRASTRRLTSGEFYDGLDCNKGKGKGEGRATSLL
ncbi:unnamed protein product [Cylicocyclus nassatus]|uniref:Uncharacterized protein n=1 Tax=Cylicocyclus nassatus TaxID=53992 RepID=A0AA36MBT6_CYLNA|nr:unnamed protein product [Cylicocyclus nassatus]